MTRSNCQSDKTIVGFHLRFVAIYFGVLYVHFLPVSKIERTVLKDPRIKSVVDPISVILLIRVHAVLSGRSFVASETTATLEHRVIAVEKERNMHRGCYS
jgi:hypothetical protein